MKPIKVRCDINKLDAIVAMTQGKKVRRNEWLYSCYLYLSDETNCVMDEKNHPRNINTFYDGDWEIYEEPKKKITVYRPNAYWIQQDSSGIELYCDSDPWFKSKDDFFSFWESDATIHNKDAIDWEEKEVEVDE